MSSAWSASKRAAALAALQLIVGAGSSVSTVPATISTAFLLSHFAGRFIHLAEELVYKHNVIYVASAGGGSGFVCLNPHMVHAGALACPPCMRPAWRRPLARLEQKPPRPQWQGSAGCCPPMCSPVLTPPLSRRQRRPRAVHSGRPWWHLKCCARHRRLCQPRAGCRRPQPAVRPPDRPWQACCAVLGVCMLGRPAPRDLLRTGMLPLRERGRRLPCLLPAGARWRRASSIPGLAGALHQMATWESISLPLGAPLRRCQPGRSRSGSS